MNTSFHQGWHRGGRRSKGFTLIELLVVIGIIGLLAAMVLPALSKAKAQGYNVICKNNLRQQGWALKMYADDNQGRYPVAVSAIRSDTGAFIYAATWKELLLPYDKMTLTNPASHCPIYVQNHGFTGIAQPTIGEAWYGSYSINTEGMVSTGQMEHSLGISSAYASRTPVRENWIVSPSDMFTIADAREFPVTPDMDAGGPGLHPDYAPVGSTVGYFLLEPWNNGGVSDLVTPDAMAQEFPPPHGQCYNVVHVDGHVAQITRRNLYYPPATSTHWNNDHNPHAETWEPASGWVVKQ